MALAQSVADIQARQRWPWNNLIDIDYTVSGVTETNGLYIRFEVENPAVGMTREAATLDPEPPVTNGRHRVTWNPDADGIRMNADAAVCWAVLRRDDPHRYMVVDLSPGAAGGKYPVTYLSAPPGGGWGDEYRTNKIALRKIDGGSFNMGGPGRPVTLTAPFYIGVFEVTQEQWKLVMGNNPSGFQEGSCRPVEKVSYEEVRGSVENGCNWPQNGGVSSDSFMGKLQERTDKAFDLPTEAQWEYACRAGTTGDYNVDGKALGELGRYGANQAEGRGGFTANHTKVGSYLPNAWGLYDMHGNVWEWVRDLYGEIGSDPVTDPPGSREGSNRVSRGGAWNDASSYCRSVSRESYTPDRHADNNGFRLFCPAGN